MTLRAYYELSCDDGCGIAYNAPFDTLCDSRLMEAAAEAEGWQTRHANRRRGRRHRCPDCVTKANALKESR